MPCALSRHHAQRKYTPLLPRALTNILRTDRRRRAPAPAASCTAPLSPYTPKAVTYHEQSHNCRFVMGHSLGRMGIPISLPHFCLYEVVSRHMCVLPYKCRTLLEMLVTLKELCAKKTWGAGVVPGVHDTARCPQPIR